MLKEVQDSAGRIILFIDELHTVVGTGAAEGAGTFSAGTPAAQPASSTPRKTRAG